MATLEQATTHNPYAPPNSSATDFKPSQNRFLFIWIWLPFASVGSLLIAPADVACILIYNLVALLYFLAGAIATSNAPKSLKLIWFVLTFLSTGLAGLSPEPRSAQEMLPIIPFFAMNSLFGVKSCREVRQRRGVIFGTLAACYIGGMLFIPIGVLLTCVPGILTVEAKTRHRDTPNPTNEEIPQ